MMYILIFVIVVLLNLYISFWKKDLEQFKNKISIGKYVKEINESLVSSVGEKNTTLIKIAAVLLSIAIVFYNAVFFLGCLGAVVSGTITAKKLHQIPATSNIINKIATYINRLK